MMMKLWNRMIWSKAAGEPWAITPAGLETILDIAARQNEPPEAVAAKLGRELQNTHRLEMRENIAVLPLVGPLFRYANLFTQISGASSYELLARDFTTALENPDVQAIVLNIDSPGGEVNGCAELADMVYEARGRKPVIAYASGDAASGAYWIAAAADEIVVSKTSALGSIGVVGVYQGGKDTDTVEVVSSQSPFKRLDPGSDEGRARLQKRIDAMAGVFVDAVAKYRGATAAHVQEHYGSGDVFIGGDAVSQGLADRVGSFEKLLSELGGNGGGERMQASSSNSISPQEKNMDDIKSLREAYPDLTASLEQEAEGGGIKAERDRLKEILSHTEAADRSELAKHLAFETDMTVEAAVALLSKAPKEQQTHAETSGFQAAMDEIPNPTIIPSREEDEEADEDVAKRLASY
ncbi:S49 family peptidase [Pseudemcibacter aquimaris]|uniref:S49 family peptidase n=2 Tax=Pseudemcibacter aquimaris TaxID=2857064 RepID=UPI00237E097B|nr:S49 family peptidase [Pseudemcibacter aquimaris]WDU57868.1 S49 family peptidase [Pseudemcibacter aquimaris]